MPKNEQKQGSIKIGFKDKGQSNMLTSYKTQNLQLVRPKKVINKIKNHIKRIDQINQIEKCDKRF